MSVPFISREEYERHQSAIDTDVRLILSLKGKSRRRFRGAAVYDRATGDLLAESVRTTFGTVVVVHYAGGYRTHPLTGPDDWFHLNTRSGQPALRFFAAAGDAGPYWVRGHHFITNTSPNRALVFR